MGYQVSWWLEERVLLVKLKGFLMSREIIESSVAIHTHVAQGIAPVHLVIDGREMTYMAPRIDKIHELTEFLAHDNMGETIVVHDDKILRFIAHVVGTVQKTTIHQVTSREEAHHLLLRLDKTLSTLPDTPI